MYILGTLLVPRPPPRFYFEAVEKNGFFLHGCEIKSGRRPENEANVNVHPGGMYTMLAQ